MPVAENRSDRVGIPSSVRKRMPDPAFKAKAGAMRRGTAYPASDFPGWSGTYSEILDDKVRDATPLARVGWATLFAYMHRRFGPPGEPGDRHRDLSAAWFLDTPDPDVFVLVRPSPSAEWRMTMPFMVAAERPSPYVPDNGTAHRIASAYEATLLDLLRPVKVRDVDIDARGEVGAYEEVDEAPDADPAGPADVDVTDDDDGEAWDALKVEPHATCGVAIPVAMVGGPGWADLCALASTLGEGDMGEGRALANAILAGMVLARHADAPREAKVLARARMAVLRRADMGGHVPLDDAGKHEADDLAPRLQALVREGAEHPLLSEGNLSASGAILADVGLRDGISEGISKARFEIAHDALYGRLVTSLGDAASPSLLPEPDTDAAAFSVLLRGAGLDGTADIVDEAMSTEGGRSLMRMAMYGLGYRLRQPAGKR